MALTSTSELVQATTFIFAGTVLELGASSVPHVPPDTKLITARLDRSLRVDPLLGDLRGQTITVDVGSSETFEVGQQYVFFADSWVHGRGIAVRETAHVDAAEAERVAELVASLPERHLVARLLDADSVVDAEVTSIDEPEFSIDQHDGRWAAAHLNVHRALKGTPPSPPVVYFPTAEWPPWNLMPRLSVGQAGSFLLHAPPPDTAKEGGTLPAGALVVLDDADCQDTEQTARVRRLVAALTSEGDQA